MGLAKAPVSNDGSYLFAVEGGAAVFAPDRDSPGGLVAVTVLRDVDAWEGRPVAACKQPTPTKPTFGMRSIGRVICGGWVSTRRSGSGKSERHGPLSHRPAGRLCERVPPE